MSSGERLFVTGIGTEVGKTMVSAALCQTLGYDYWKPVQCGSLDLTDTHKVGNMTGCKTWPEAFRLEAPLSPHHAAELEGIQVTAEALVVPETDSGLVIEGAGGLLVPMNQAGYTFGDFALDVNCPAIVVVRHYLGSINHTALTLETMLNRGIDVAGIVVSGDRYKEGEQFWSQSGVPVVGHLPELVDENEIKGFEWYGLD